MNLAEVPVEVFGNLDSGLGDHLTDFPPIGPVRADGSNVDGHHLERLFAVKQRPDVVGAERFQVPDLTDGFFEFHQNVLALLEDSAVFDLICHSRKDLVLYLNDFALTPV